MFLPVKNAGAKGPRPAHSGFSESDWGILASFWHPVALSSEVTDKPWGTTLLDVPVVLYRTPEGVSAARDVCPHRSARLSLGTVRDGRLVCGFHGFEYAADGACTRIPALAADTPIPRKLCLQAYLCQERYGLVWVCLSKVPRAGLPEWPHIEDGSGIVAVVPPGTWNASAARHIENFTDLCHVPFIHTSTFGGPEVVIEPYEVQVDGMKLAFEAPVVERVRYVGEDTGYAQPQLNHAIYRYETILPFSTSVKVHHPEKGTTYRVFDVGSPVTASTTRIFQIVVDEGRTVPAEALIDFTERINGEDLSQVVAQSPQALPLDLRDEIHIPADRMSVEYRRALAALGLGADMAR
ncbi:MULTISPECIES: aromatic ring-hydroxylating dioxygenase subunit alpha [unclassified Variovorax]|uniref:aromatic ring-hydroxylating oxygenase subunit alpha n=1 Tax=unclassified Variovorax TaxID=663243 RepID=UPI001BD33BD5|nr:MULTISPECIES: aromatic ring-hydroxylating dioxygenase subunit alpha [unclassified Variovorax]